MLAESMTAAINDSVHSSLGHTDMVALLLEWGADVNATNDSGVTLSMLTYFLYPHV